MKGYIAELDELRERAARNKQIHPATEKPKMFSEIESAAQKNGWTAKIFHFTPEHTDGYYWEMRAERSGHFLTLNVQFNPSTRRWSLRSAILAPTQDIKFDTPYYRLRKKDLINILSNPEKLNTIAYAIAQN